MFKLSVFIVLNLYFAQLHADKCIDKVVKRDSVSQCRCVKLAECNDSDGGVITDGTGLIAFRLGTTCKFDEVCCKFSVEAAAQGSNANEGEDMFIDDGYTGDTYPQDNDPALIEDHVNPVATDDPEDSDVPDVDSSIPFICGWRQSATTSTKISGNRDDTFTEYGDFPWTLIVKYLVPVEEGGSNEQVLVCGASLIAPSLAITVANKIEKKKAENLIVRAGEWDLGSDDETIPPQERRVKRVIVHPKFDDRPIMYDVAILVLEKPFQANPAVNTICLPDNKRKLMEWSKCYATGWGAAGNGAIPMNDAVMRKAKLPLVPNDECQRLLRLTEAGERFKLHPSFLCAGGDGETDSCKGDGGGPLACESPEPPHKFYLVGVTSWGIGCARKNVPGAYTSINAVSHWIISTVDKLVEDRVIPAP